MAAFLSFLITSPLKKQTARLFIPSPDPDFADTEWNITSFYSSDNLSKFNPA